MSGSPGSGKTMLSRAFMSILPPLTQKEAIERGKQIAMNQGAELYIHNKQGQIRERNTYGTDPYPPAG